jgi:hypothetical protein
MAKHHAMKSVCLSRQVRARVEKKEWTLTLPEIRNEADELGATVYSEIIDEALAGQVPIGPFTLVDRVEDHCASIQARQVLRTRVRNADRVISKGNNATL